MRAMEHSVGPDVEEYPDGERERSIGDIIRDSHQLSSRQMERVLAYQRETGVRIGEALVALKLASEEDVVNALAQQFQYPYAYEQGASHLPELVTLNQPYSAQAETFRALRSQLISRVFGVGDRRALAVLSPTRSEGRSYVAANLAVVLAQLGGRTLLIDADLRHSRQQQLFGLENRAGLSAILAGRSRSKVIQSVAGVPSLHVLPVGVTPPNPLELIERQAFAMVVQELASRFDYVIVDTPAAEVGADAVAIAARCGSGLIVVRQGHTRSAAVRELVANLSGSPAKLAGLMLNRH
ncbi:MAG: polysaccharide biosynthesis tyrosine autokinase [Rubrivivax sp.]